MFLAGNPAVQKRDADLIEILWKQDIDLGISKEAYDAPGLVKEDEKSLKELEHKKLKNESETPEVNDSWGGLNYTIDTETGEFIIIPSKEPEKNEADLPVPNEQDHKVPNEPEIDFMDLLDSFSVSSALYQTDNSGSNNDVSNLINKTCESGVEECEDLLNPGPSAFQNQQSVIEDLEREMREIEIPEANYTDLTTRNPASVTRLPLMHSIEDRWQDVANLLDIPNNLTSAFVSDATATNNISSLPLNTTVNMTAFHGTPTTVGNLEPALIENATLPVPVQPLSPVMNPVNTTILDQPNFITNALSSLTNGSEPHVDGSSANFSFENSFFPFANNQTIQNVSGQASGFLSGLLSDEDLELMGIAMSESGVENVNQTEDKVDVSSDSAVSSMSSERFQAFSDGEWFDSSSESSQQDHHERYFGTNLSPNGMYRLPTYMNASGSAEAKYYNMNGTERSNIAQKKYKFFGKRILQESPNSDENNSGNDENRNGRMHASHMNPVKTKNYDNFDYHQSQAEGAVAMMPSSSRLVSQHNGQHPINVNDMVPDYVYHNHTYMMPPEKEGMNSRPCSRDKISRQQIDSDKGLSRDERRAKELRIPLSIEDIVNLSMDEFNEKLSKYDFNETQLTLIRDIRRRGKNKVAAQNCRKRKLDQIFSLEDELKQLKDKKSSSFKRKQNLTREKETSYYNYLQLHDKILRSLMLRQQQQQHVNVGQPYANPENYTLQLTPDGNVYLSPRNCTNSTVEFPNSSNYRHPNSK